ncbi:MAG: N-6 DNA methylase [Actinobacteria bacterium]|uniref:site-specific DNA-methyltransferase (adenine-specific) n=1 Tax=freshwater metagenome TaxID=449393 RepID=A0A6J6X557_9ZZZZ|nr:N-6 DNA methylase [Actinomycetota bacterium]
MIARISVKSLRSIRTIADVLAFLADELDWPIDGVDADEATFEYSPEELGVAADQVPTLKLISQLRPLTTRQPWGIFFLQFAGPRLPLTPLRRLLQKLVETKRATGSHATWKLEHLLFIVTTNSADAVELHFVAFRTDEGHVAEVRSLPWRPEQSPKLYLERLAGELLPRLAWPADTDDVDGWTNQWRQAFALRHGEVIANADRLAERMADVATELRHSVKHALDREGKKGPFHTLLAAVETELVAGVDEARFADMCAQTLVYGTLTARVTDPDAFGASSTLTAVPLANPFLAAFFEQVHDQVVALELPDGGLESLVADLRSTNVEAILDHFGDNAKGGDPVVHFYEEFLKRYDSKMRADAGAFYTPQPVVEFMVRAVDEILKLRFGLTEGLADRSSWAEVSKHLGVPIPKGIKPSEPFLSMIDPATGTGTFLVEWIRRAEASYREAHPKGNWAARLQNFVLPSMHAFEIMLAPYAIAHLKVALEAHSQGLDGAAASIYLTDTLEHPADQGSFDIMTDPIAVEGKRAADLKQGHRFTVVIGNPPYDREQQSPGSTGHRKGGIVRHGAPGIKPLLDDITDVMSANGLGVHTKNLYNDYVYFWRWATWQVTQLPAGPGVVAFITAASYLDGKSMAGLRAHLRGAFDELWIIDLGGEGRGAQTEENVFDIRTPVAIAIGIRTTGTRTCTTRYLRISGDRAAKFAWLRASALISNPWTEIAGEGIEPLTPAGDTAYFSWPEVTDLLPWIHSGAQFKRTWPIGPTKSLLERRWEELLSRPKRERMVALKESRDRKLSSLVTPLGGGGRLQPLERLRPGDDPTGLSRYGYRSFDRQWCISDSRVGDYLRESLWTTASTKQVFLTTLTSTKLGKGPVATVSPYVPDLDHFRGSYGAKNVIPLWRDGNGRKPNITSGVLEVLRRAWGDDIQADDLLAYVYALTGTGAYAERFADELAVIAGPFRVPLTANLKLAKRAVAMGRELLWLHTWGDRFQPDDDRAFPTAKASERTPIRGYPERFTYDEKGRLLVVGSGSFGPIAPDIWTFEVSGLRVIPSWLGYRMADGKGKKSSPLDDIRPERWTFTPELLQLVAILEQTVRLTPKAAELLADIVTGELIDPSTLPTPTDVERKAATG